MYATLTSFIIGAILAFVGAWNLQGARITKLELDYANERNAQQLAAQQAAERHQAAFISATAAATSRANLLRVAAAAARSESDGLRESIATAMQAATASHDACLERAHALGVVFTQSTEQLTTMAERCDRHVSDVQTLTDAWPK